MTQIHPNSILTPEDTQQLLANEQEMVDWYIEHNTWNTVGLYPKVKLTLTTLNIVWLLYSIDEDNHQRVFGLADYGNGQPEYGWLDLEQTQQVCQTWGYQLHREANFIAAVPMDIYRQVAYQAQRIVEDEQILQAAYQQHWLYGAKQ